MKILLVDDDPGVREALALSLSAKHEVIEADSVDAALDVMGAGFDLVITDLKMPKKSGQTLVETLRASDGPPVIVLTAHGSVDAAVAAMSAGAVDFLEKPVKRAVLELAIDKVARASALATENRALKQKLDGFVAGELLTASPKMRAVLARVDQVASSDVTVLITGESGTGKELVARRLHARSARSGAPFVALNCAALPKELLEAELFGHEKGAFTGADKARPGRFMAADGGTLFLDEIGDLALELQVKLLRVLQEREVPVVGGAPTPVDVRVVCATHVDLEAAVRDGRFREDLFFRVRVVPVEVPALRERPEDIALLLKHFLARSARPLEVDDAALKALSARPWRGNVRELENVATRIALTTTGARVVLDDIADDDGALETARASLELDENALALPQGGVSLRGVERALILAALSRAGKNRSQAARLLRVPRHVLLYRMEKFALSDEDVDALEEGRAPILDLSE